MKALAGVAALTLGFLSVVPAMCAAETPEFDNNANDLGEPFAPDVRVSLSSPLQSGENLSFGAVEQAREAPGGGADASELNRELTNPVSSLWSIANQFNNFELNNGHWSNNWNFQPVLPIIC